jgi:hypothetical protein
VHQSWPRICAHDTELPDTLARRLLLADAAIAEVEAEKVGVIMSRLDDRLDF